MPGGGLLSGDSNFPIRYGASFKSITALAANTPETIVAPGTNVNGVIVHFAQYHTGGVANSPASILAKTSAPTTVIDGDILLLSSTSGAGNVAPNSGTLRPIFVAPGKGIYRISTGLEGAGHCQVLYTVL